MEYTGETLIQLMSLFNMLFTSAFAVAVVVYKSARGYFYLHCMSCLIGRGWSKHEVRRP